MVPIHKAARTPYSRLNLQWLKISVKKISNRVYEAKVENNRLKCN